MWRRLGVGTAVVSVAQLVVRLRRPCAVAQHAEEDSNSIHSRMAHIFDGLPDVHTIPGNEEDAIDASGGHEGYGELMIEGTAVLLEMLQPKAGKDVFFDFGSGAGRILVQIALENPLLHAVGLELALSRHKVACAALERVNTPHGCEARLGDMLTSPCNDATLVFIAGLLFDDDFMRRLADRLCLLPRLRAIATLRRFPPDGCMALASVGYDERKEAVPLQCTWGMAAVYIYERNLGQDE